MTSKTQKLVSPAGAINLMYNLRYVEPGETVEVFVRDVEALEAEGWTSTKAKKSKTIPPRRRARRTKKVK